MNIIDIVVLVLLLLVALIGFWKGFLGSLLSFFSSALSVTCAFFLAKPLASLMNNWFNLGATIGTSISNKIAGFFTDFAGPLTGAQIMADECSATGILKTALNFFIRPETSYADKAEVVTKAGTSAGNLILMAICMIVAFILIKLVIFLLSKLFGALKKKSVAINGLDRVLGVVLGLAKGCLIVFAVFVIANLLQSIPAVANFLDTTFNNSSIAKPIYDFINNIVSNYLTKIDFNGILASF
ncbi:MAG: CvpA family protein [Christensenellales bacterium]